MARRGSLEQIFETQIDLLATTLQPNSLLSYRRAVKSFLRYLRANHPRVSSLAGLRRDPHILGWLHHLCDQDPPSSKGTRLLYLLCFRRLLNDLADGGDYIIQEGLIRREDFPRLDQYLPKPLSLDDDERLQDQLRTHDDLFSNALLLLRGTGMRIGELLDLPTDCLRHLGGRDWALHVPLGKLHTDRWVPVDDDVRRIHARLVALRQHSGGTAHSNLLLPLPAKPGTRYIALLRAVRAAARKAGCSVRVKATSTQTHLCNIDAAGRRQPPRPHASARPQNPRDDLALRSGHPKRPTAAIPSRTAKYAEPSQHAATPHHSPAQRYGAGNPNDYAVPDHHPPSPRDVSASTRRRQHPPQARTLDEPTHEDRGRNQ